MTEQKQDNAILKLMAQGWQFDYIANTVDEKYALKAYHPDYGTVIGKDTTGYMATWHCVKQCQERST